jgi:hypothetical protein
VRYYPLLVPYTPHNSRISIYIHWTLSCYMILTLFIYRYKYSAYRAPSPFHIYRQFDVRYNPFLCRIHRKSLGLVYITTRPCHIIWFYRCSYTGISIQFTVSPSLYHISRQFDVRYNPLVVPYKTHVTPICLYELQTLSYHMILLLSIYRYKYSVYRISVAICHI